MSLFLHSSCSTSADVFPEANTIRTILSTSTCLCGVWHVPWHFRCPMNCWMNESVFKRRNHHSNCVDKNTEEVLGMIRQLQVTDFFSRKDTHTPHRAGCLSVLDSPHVTLQQQLRGPGSWHITPQDYGFLYVAHLVVFFQQKLSSWAAPYPTVKTWPQVWEQLGEDPGVGNGTPLQYSCLENPIYRGAWWAAIHGVTKSRIRLSDFTFHFHALEKEMATHSTVLAWRIPGTGEPGGLPSMGSYRVRHDWSDLAAAAAAAGENPGSNPPDNQAVCYYW